MRMFLISYSKRTWDCNNNCGKFLSCHVYNLPRTLCICSCIDYLDIGNRQFARHIRDYSRTVTSSIEMYRFVNISQLHTYMQDITFVAVDIASSTYVYDLDN